MSAFNSSAARPVPAWSAALDAFLESEGREGASLGLRTACLVWKGGLGPEEMRTLGWKDVTADCRSWRAGGGRPRPVPMALRPWLRRWREEDQALGLVLRRPRSQRPQSPALLEAELVSFLSRAGLEGLTLADLNGAAGRDLAACRAPVLRMAWERPRLRPEDVCRELGLEREDALRLLSELAGEGALTPLNVKGWCCRPDRPRAAERFAAALESLRGRTVTLEELRRASGLGGNAIYHYIKEALADGSLCRERRGCYRCLGKDGI